MPQLDDRLILNCMWYDHHACVERCFTLSFYLSDGSIELYEPSLHRMFLRRTRKHTLCADQLYLGNTVRVHSRSLKLVSYGTSLTRTLISERTQRTMCLVHVYALTDSHSLLSLLCDICDDRRLQIVNARTVTLTCAETQCYLSRCVSAGRDVAAESQQQKALAEQLSAGSLLALELMGVQAVAELKAFLGPCNVESARSQAPNSLRAKYGVCSCVSGGLHASDSDEQAMVQLEYMFYSSARPQSTCTPGDTVCCTCTACTSTSGHGQSACDAGHEYSACLLVLPHVVEERLWPHLLRDIFQPNHPSCITHCCYDNKDGNHGNNVAAHMSVRALQMVRLDQNAAVEYVRVYRTVISEYAALLDQLTAGVALAVQVTSTCARTLETVRRIVGPADPAMAVILRPHTLRAKYGRTRVYKAVHCSDLEEEVTRELRLLFSLPSVTCKCD